MDSYLTNILMKCRIAYQYCTWQCENEAERSGDSGGQELSTLHSNHIDTEQQRTNQLGSAA